MKKKEELFKSPRWNEYQPVEVLKGEVKPTEKDKKEIEEFKKFIDKKVENKALKNK